MEYRRIGRTDLLVSPIAFGAFGIGSDRNSENYGRTDDRSSRDALRFAFENGCNFVDTAAVYGSGHSEQLIGKVLAGTPQRHDIVICTKVGQHAGHTVNHRDFTPTALTCSIQASLARLGKETLDLVLLHNPTLEELSRQEIWSCLERLVAIGDVRYFGVSVHTAAEAVRSAKQPGVVAVQRVRNLLTDILDIDSSENEGAAFSSEKTAVIGREPLANGFLCSNPRGIEKKFDAGDIRTRYGADTVRFRRLCAERIAPLAADSGLSIQQFALRHAALSMGLTSVVVGMKTREQVRENLAAVVTNPF